jgi:hypothetical protein
VADRGFACNSWQGGFVGGGANTTTAKEVFFLYLFFFHRWSGIKKCREKILTQKDSKKVILACLLFISRRNNMTNRLKTVGAEAIPFVIG